MLILRGRFRDFGGGVYIVELKGRWALALGRVVDLASRSFSPGSCRAPRHYLLRRFLRLRR